jgi:FdrA protein
MTDPTPTDRTSNGVLRYQVRAGAYHDSIVLMQLRVALSELPGVHDAGAVMGAAGNLDLLRDGGLLPPDVGELAAEDLLVAVRAEDEKAAEAALDRVDELLARRRVESDRELRPRSLASALETLPEARWVLVSVPGRYAAGVAREALDRGRHVFLFSDHVEIEDEVALKRRAAAAGLLVMGPDCGTAIVAGAGLGFANRVRRGPVGLVAASGTGLQTVASRLHTLGTGVSHALGTGGRDLSAAVGGATALQAVDLLGRDPDTEVLVLVSKPPAPEVTARVLAALADVARTCGKPAVVCLLGRALPFRRLGDLHFATSLSEAAETAAGLVGARSSAPPAAPGTLRRERHLRGLFSGGTLAQEALEGWTALFGPVTSNLKAPGSRRWEGSEPVEGHLLLDLGDDALTAGRPHPMLDPALVAERLERAAQDPEVAAVLLDVVLGDGAHPDPASILAPAIRTARASRPGLEIVALVVGTDEDPQDLGSEWTRLEEAGARVVSDLPAAQEILYDRCAPQPSGLATPVPLSALDAPLAAVNVGIETFYGALRSQGVEAVQVEWRPPAGGDERLLSILQRMKNTG